MNTLVRGAAKPKWLADFETKLDTNAAIRARTARIKLRTERRALVNDFASDRDGYWRLIHWLSAPVRGCALPWTIQEVMSLLEKEIAGQNASRDHRMWDDVTPHWSYNPGKLADCRKRLIVARYFNRYSQSVWAVEVAA
jgi:hypothetical protein